MTLKQILEIVKTIPPTHPHRKTFSYRDISFVKLGEGRSRVAYAIVGTPWIVKFGESHREVEAILALRSNPLDVGLDAKGRLKVIDCGNFYR